MFWIKNAGSPTKPVTVCSSRNIHSIPLPQPTPPPEDTPERKRVREELSAKCGFDIRGNLNMAQKSKVRAVASQIAKRMNQETAAIDRSRKTVQNLADLLESDYSARPDVVAKHFPAHYRQFYPKDIITPNGWYSPRSLGSVFAAADAMRLEVDTPGLSGPANPVLTQIEGLVIAGHLWSKVKCPVFFLSKGLAEAVDATYVPDTYAPPPFQWPLPSFALMMGRGMLRLGGKDVSAILYSRTTHADDIVRVPRPVFDNGGPFDKLYREIWSCRDVVATRDPDAPPRLLQLITLVMADGDTVTRELVDFRTLDQGRSSALGADEAELATLCADSLPALLYAVKVLLILQHSPALVERVSEVVHEPGKPKRSKFDPNAKWSANFLGRNYQMRGSEGSGKEGSGTRRPHIRRGHARSQPYGPGRSLTRERWIEPIRVNWSKWKPGDPLYIDHETLE